MRFFRNSGIFPISEVILVEIPDPVYYLWGGGGGGNGYHKLCVLCHLIRVLINFETITIYWYIVRVNYKYNIIKLDCTAFNALCNCIIIPVLLHLMIY